MILEWFVDFVFGFFLAMLRLIPFPLTLDLGALAPAFGVMGTFDMIFPVTDALAGAAVVLGLTALLFLYRIVKTVAAHIPFVGGTG